MTDRFIPLPTRPQIIPKPLPLVSPESNLYPLLYITNNSIQIKSISYINPNARFQPTFSK